MKTKEFAFSTTEVKNMRRLIADHNEHYGNSETLRKDLERRVKMNPDYTGVNSIALYNKRRLALYNAIMNENN